MTSRALIVQHRMACMRVDDLVLNFVRLTKSNGNLKAEDKFDLFRPSRWRSHSKLQDDMAMQWNSPHTLEINWQLLQPNTSALQEVGRYL